MDTIQKMQLKERTSGTLLRLGWLASVLTFVPLMFYGANGLMVIGKFIYYAVLVLVAIATFFLLFLDEGFRKLFHDDDIDMMPLVRKVYQNYSALVYVFLAIGLVLGVLSLILAIKENNGKSSRKRIISSCFMIAFAILGAVIYAVTKSKVMEA